MMHLYRNYRQTLLFLQDKAKCMHESSGSDKFIQYIIVPITMGSRVVMIH